MENREVRRVVRDNVRRLVPHAWWVLPAFLLVPPLFKASIQPFLPIDITVVLAALAGAVGLAWLTTSERGTVRAALPGLILWATLTALVATWSLLAADRSVALRTTAYWVFLTTIPLLAAFPVAADSVQLRRFLLALFSVGLALIAIGLVVLPFVERGGLNLLGANRISVARGILLAPLVAVPLWLWPPGRRRAFAVVLVAVATFLSVTTGSRGPVIAFAITMLVLLVIALIWTPRKREALALAAATLVLTSLTFATTTWLVPADAVGRFAILRDEVAGSVAGPTHPPADEPVRETSVGLRIRLFTLAAEAFVAQPLVGHGTGGYETLAAAVPAVAPHTYPHNLILAFAADFGVVGLIVLAALAGAALKVVSLASAPVDVALAAVLAYLVLNAMVSNGIYENRLLWGVWAIVLASPALGALRSPLGRPIGAGVSHDELERYPSDAR